MKQQKQNFLLPIIMMFALFAMISFVTGLTNPIGVIVKNQFNLPDWMTQLGNAANFAAYLFMGIPSGIMLKRIGYKKTALVAIAVGFVGVLVQFFSSKVGVAEGGELNFMPFYVYLFGAFISGFAMCMLNAVVNPMLNTLAGGGRKGNQLLQFGGTLNSLSATVVPVFVGLLIADISKAQLSDAVPALLIALGVFATAFVVLAVVNIPEPYALEKGDAVKVKEKYSPLSFRHFVLGIVAIFLYVGVEVGIPNFINLFLTTAQDVTSGAAGMGILPSIAGSVVGTYWFLMMCGRLCGGILGTWFTSRQQMIGVCTVALILIVAAIYTPATTTVSMPVFNADLSFGFASVPLSVMLLVLCGLCTSIMWSGIFNLAVEGLGRYTSMASGIFMVMVVGGGVLPLIQGYIAGATANYMASYWVIFASIAYMFFYAVIGSRNVNKDIPVED